MDKLKYIPLSECKHGHLYKIDSRNLTYGIFNSETKGFTGIRTKYNNVYLFEEYHWDTGEPYGTVKPIKEMEDITCLLEDQKTLFDYLSITLNAEKQSNITGPKEG